MQAFIYPSENPLSFVIRNILESRGHFIAPNLEQLDPAADVAIDFAVHFVDVGPDSIATRRASHGESREPVIVGMAGDLCTAAAAANDGYHDILTTEMPRTLVERRIALIEENIEQRVAVMRLAANLERERCIVEALRENGSDVHCVNDEDHRFVRANQATAKTAGLAENSDILGLTDLDLHGLEQARTFIEEENEIKRNGIPVVERFEGPLGPCDKPVWLLGSTSRVCDRGGRVLGLVGSARDATARTTAERQLAQSEARFQSLIEQLPVMTYELRISGRRSEIVYVSPRVETILGYTVDEYLRTTYEDRVALVHPDERSTIFARFREALAHRTPFVADFRIRKKSGDWVWIHNEVQKQPDHPDSDEIVQHWQGIIIDLTERRAMEAKLEHQAFHDPLTDLPNRALFTEKLELALTPVTNSESSVTVFFLDLDDFKVVNDSLGHEKGDILLVDVAARIRSVVRESDLVARLGGDEFTILLGATTSEPDAFLMAERIIQAISRPFELAERAIYVTASVGIAHGKPGRSLPRDLMREADVAMYQAKRAGKGAIRVFDPSLDEIVTARLLLEQDLRQAIVRNEFDVFYQPIVDSQTGAPKMMEALMRWRHPRWGLTMPREFVALAEEIGLILPIGRWVLKQSCLQAQAWEEQDLGYPPLIVSVNLSVSQFRHPALLEDVERSLRETGLAPGRLQLEITESVLVDDVDSALETMHHLRSLGVRLALDDFGTGYSSLSYLKRLPIDLIKIDRSFIQGLGSDPKDEMIVKAIVSLTQALDMEVAAEGVESAGQLFQVRHLRFGLAQGFLFAEPRPAVEAWKLARRLEATTRKVDRRALN